MKILFTIGLVLLLSGAAKAERWIVKNPKVMRSDLNFNIRSQHIVNFQNQYLIIDSSDQALSEQMLMRVFNADSVFRDTKVVIDDPEQKPVEEKKAWHVENLKYDSLNKDYSGQGVIVAVLDTGVDYRHPALENHMWKNILEIPDNGIDDDNNGLVDDYHGFNFDSMTADPNDRGGHGTHCAGIIASDVNETSNAQGVAPGAKIMPLLIIGNYHWGFLSAAASAVKYATDNGAKVLSNSWRVYHSWDQYMNPEGLEMLKEAIQYAEENGVVFVAAAGNEAKDIDVTNLENPIYPLAFEGLNNFVGVAASQQPAAGMDPLSEGKIAYFSNYGINSVAVSAPGKDIISTYPIGQWRSMSGTSMATPIVAGTLARGFSKGYRMEEAIEELNKTTKKSTYWQDYVTHGPIDIENYIK